IAPGLSYCNYCGARLSGDKSETPLPAVKPETLIGAMVFTFVFGIAAITMLVGVLKAIIRLETGLILSLGFLSLLVMIALEGVFITLLFAGRRRTAEKEEALKSKGLVTSEVEAAQAKGLADAPASVTEHTTRAFEPVERKR
ncbi:MAG TPA: hypothetical protein VJT71_12970, partial [Pyrinomonadaceae bacterium]|nr:hypothetical protein [Pyrinomonadaceae bacterium]